MDIKSYFEEINKDFQGIFVDSLSNKEKLGTLHYFSSEIKSFSDCINDEGERDIFSNVACHMELSNYSLLLGLYRQAFAALRLSLEMGMAGVYFSVNKLDMQEWCDGLKDVRWSELTDVETGVLSKRFVKAFFSSEDIFLREANTYREDALDAYRKLSEYVHGNKETWPSGERAMLYRDDLFEKYIGLYEKVSKIIIFSMLCRYLKSLGREQRDGMDSLCEVFPHIENLKEFF